MSGLVSSSRKELSDLGIGNFQEMYGLKQKESQ